MRCPKGVLGALLALGLVSGCARPPSPEPQPKPVVEAPPTYRIALAPEAGAACIAANVPAVAAGAAAHVQPLYGTERLAVVVRTRPAGEALAVAYIDLHKTGSVVRVATTPHFIGQREELARRLLAGC